MGRVRRRQFRGRRGRLRRQSRRWQHGRLRREQLGLLRGGQRCRQLGRHRLRQPRGLLGRLGCRDAAVSWADFGFDSWAGFGADRVAWPGILGLCSARALLWVADLNGSLLPVMRACGARSPLHEWQRRPTERSGRHGLTNVRAALLRSSSAKQCQAGSRARSLRPRRRRGLSSEAWLALRVGLYLVGERLSECFDAEAPSTTAGAAAREASSTALSKPPWSASPRASLEWRGRLPQEPVWPTWAEPA